MSDFKIRMLQILYHEEESRICETNQCWVIRNESMKNIIGKLIGFLFFLGRDTVRMGLSVTTTKGIGMQHFYTF